MSNTNTSFYTNARTLAVIDKLASSSDRSRSYIINKAIGLLVDIDTWQTRHIKEAIALADKGEFASGSEVEKLFSKKQS